MVIIWAKLRLVQQEIQNDMSLLLEWVSPSNRIFTDILKFDSKSRPHFGLLSFTYLIVERLNVLELQVNHLRCPYDIQEKISPYIQQK